MRRHELSVYCTGMKYIQSYQNFSNVDNWKYKYRTT